jgi:hypothetical protein
VDARAWNWRNVVPAEPTPLVVAAGHASLAQVLDGPPADAVVVPDLGGWPDRGRAVLAAVCSHVRMDGWVCVGFANRWYPAAPLASGAMGLHDVHRTVDRCGLTVTATYIALPDHRHPAVFVPAEHRAELDHVLRRMLVTYVPGDSSFPRLTRRAMSVLRTAALHSPHGLRRDLLPGYLVLARRLP